MAAVLLTFIGPCRAPSHAAASPRLSSHLPVKAPSSLCGALWPSARILDSHGAQAPVDAASHASTAIQRAKCKKFRRYNVQQGDPPVGKWHTDYATECGHKVYVHEDWVSVPRFCKECLAKIAADWYDVSCKGCGAILRVHRDWDHCDRNSATSVRRRFVRRARHLTSEIPEQRFLREALANTGTERPGNPRSGWEKSDTAGLAWGELRGRPSVLSDAG